MHWFMLIVTSFVMFIDLSFSSMAYLSPFIFLPMDQGPGNKVVNPHPWWWGDGRCSSLWSLPPSVKTWHFWPQLPYRLGAQPLIPSNGTRGSRKLPRLILSSSALHSDLFLSVRQARHIQHPPFVSLCSSLSFWSLSCSSFHHLNILLFILFLCHTCSVALSWICPHFSFPSPSSCASPCPPLFTLSFCVCPSLFSNFTPPPPLLAV